MSGTQLTTYAHIGCQHVTVLEEAVAAPGRVTGGAAHPLCERVGERRREQEEWVREAIECVND